MGRAVLSRREVDFVHLVENGAVPARREVDFVHLVDNDAVPALGRAE